jgi:hypothetical protein
MVSRLGENWQNTKEKNGNYRSWESGADEMSVIHSGEQAGSTKSGNNKFSFDKSRERYAIFIRKGLLMFTPFDRRHLTPRRNFAPFDGT